MSNDDKLIADYISAGKHKIVPKSRKGLARSIRANKSREWNMNNQHNARKGK